MVLSKSLASKLESLNFGGRFTSKEQAKEVRRRLRRIK